MGGQDRVGFPDGHRFVEAPPVEVGADGAHEVGDEREDFVVGLGPVETAVLVLDVAVERHVRYVDQLGHAVSLPSLSARPATDPPAQAEARRELPRTE